MIKEKALEIINHYGVLEQLKYFQSEVFELNESIIREEEASFNYYEGYGSTNKLKEHIAREMADVTLMLKQFQYYYDISDDQIEDIMNYKADRQLKRIENEELYTEETYLKGE